MNRFPWIFSVLWLAILSVMLWAGFWQLGRAEEKAEINKKLAEKQFHAPQTTTEWQQLKAFDQVRVLGVYLDTHLILDNQIMDGQVGHFVFTAFKTNNDQLMWVNRGWTDDTQQNFNVEIKPQEITALVADWPRPGFQLGEQEVKNESRQHLTYMPQKEVSELLSQRHCQQASGEGCIILAQVLKLDASMSSGFSRNWQLPRMTVEKHNAYAAQWFTMSAVLCLLFGVFLKKTYFNRVEE